MEKHATADSHALDASRVFECVIVTPEATLRDGPAQFVALPLFDGELGIAPLHSPMIGRLGAGELRIVEGTKTERYYVEGGFVQVADNVVSIITNRAVPAENLDAKVLGEQLAAARAKQANSEELLAARERIVSQTRAQQRVAKRAHQRGSVEHY